MTGHTARSGFAIATLVVLLGGGGARAQMPSGFELTLVGVDGTKKALGQLPPTVYAPRVSPDGKRVAFEHVIRRAPTGRGSGPRSSRTSPDESLSRLSKVQSTGRRCGRLTVSGWCSSCRASAVMRSTGGALMVPATPST